MPNARKLVEHIVNFIMICLVSSVIGGIFNIFFDFESNKTIVISFIFVITMFILAFHSQINEKNKVAKYIASKLIRNPDRKLTIKDIVIIVIIFNFIPLILKILSKIPSDKRGIYDKTLIEKVYSSI